MLLRLFLFAVIAAALTSDPAVAQIADSLVAPYPADLCSSCGEWNEHQDPLRLHGNTYYVGTRGLSALLITSPEGHVLIDAGLPDSAPLIMDNIRSLGFNLADIELILNSHAHFDHAGGIAAIQQASGARVAAMAPSAEVLERGMTGPDDPQHAVALAFPAVAAVEILSDGQTVTVGPLELTAHLTAGHTPGGTSWSWRSCDQERCLDFVYADSQTPVSSDDFLFSDNDTYPSAIADFERGFAVLEELPCDVLVTPHPGASNLWERLSAGRDGIIDRGACREYAATARERLNLRLEREAAGQ